MADQNSYLRYKQDTRHLLYWMIHASNSIIKSSLPPTERTSTLPTANTTGQITVSALVPISKLIAEHIKPIPTTIYRLFQSVIAARAATHAAFQQIVTTKPDPDIEKSNASHKHFINSLTEAFEALGGNAWVSGNQQSKIEDPEADDVDAVIFSNQFSALDIHDESVPQESDNEGSDEPSVQISSARPKKKSGGKKGKRGKKAKGKQKQPAKEPKLEEVPLESYRIIEDESGQVTDYLMAVYSLVKQWVELRGYVQGLWHEVAYDKLNSAVAGAVSNIAIGMIKQTESLIFVDFPGHDSFETVMKTITRGDPDKAQGMFSMALHKVDANGQFVFKGQDHYVDVKEQFLVHAYHDLLDFITDFQSTRSGKPTKPVLAEIRDWDPNLDLQRATKEQRMKWRRAYTINWLYDLVNVFSAVVVQRNTMKGQHWVYERVDWSINGPWNKHRRLFGLNEFAGDITTLAMQKPGTDIRQRILPHHVFQLQCIVDSLATSRGWSVNSFRGHILSSPAPGFRPRRDVDIFLDRQNDRMGHGYLQSIDYLIALFKRDSEIHGDPDRHKQSSELMKDFQYDFVNWLAESKYISGLTTIPPSRFAHVNPNGLWEYSPFLCGVGLTEALDLTYAMSFLVWDRIPEPICLLHLHNMLVQKGYISEPVGIFASLQDIMSTAFFAHGKAPSSDFVESFLEVLSDTGSRRANFERRAIRRNAIQTTVDLHGILNMNMNRFYKNKSLLMVFREAGWVPDRVPEEEVPLTSSLGLIRLCRTKIVKNPITGMKELADTPLTRRAKSMGMSNEQMLHMASTIQNAHKNDSTVEIPEELKSSMPEGYSNGPPLPSSSNGNFLDDADLLGLLKKDMVSDISGEGRPLSSLNYTFVACRFMMIFIQIEGKLKEVRNPLWVKAYEEEPMMMHEKRQDILPCRNSFNTNAGIFRASLTALALAGEDQECLEIMAKEFQNPRTGWMTHMYWDDLVSMEESLEKETDNGDMEPAEPHCSVM